MAEEREPVQEEKPVAETGGGHRRPRHREKEERVAALEARVAELDAALGEQTGRAEACEKDAREYLEGWQRERASFENFRKRTAREMDEAGVVAKVELIRRILPAIDNLERALGDTSGDAEVIRKGVEMTYEQLLSTLQQQGLKEVPGPGEPFDPNVHEAIDAVAESEYPPDTVVEALQKGYTFGERLVRPARVRVAR